MLRHRVGWPMLVVVAGLIFALVAVLGSAALPIATPSTPRSADGPSAFTDTEGHFRFEGLHSASHILRVDPRTLPTGLAPDAANLTMTLSPGVTRALAIAPGLALRATYHDDGSLLDGVLFHDRDGDGLQGAGESGLAGARVIDPDVYQYFVPFDDFQTATDPANLFQSFRDVLGPGCLNDPSMSTTIVSTISLTASSNNTTIFYDQWEDGYDADPIAPAPGSSTVVYQNVLAGQGPPPWQDNIAVPRPVTPFRYDGRDRITIIGQPAAMMRAAWLDNPGTRLAGAWEMARVSDWGRHYIIPVGEDLGQRNPTPAQRTGDYDYVSVSVMAAYDNTNVTIVTDPTTPATSTRTYMLNAGQTAYVRGSPTLQVGSGIYAIRSGATVDSSLPVQVQVRAGNCRAPYSGRSYSLVPVERWTNDYWSPVSSFYHGANGCTVNYLPPQTPGPGVDLSADADIYIFNPGTAALPVNYEGPGGVGTITVPPGTTSSYLKLRFPAGTSTSNSIPRSNTQGVHLSAAGPFSAVTAVDSTSLGNNGADFDWSYTLVPAKDLSSRVVLSWAPGSNGAPPAPQQLVSGSTAYVQATQNGTRVFADLNHDGTADNFDTDGNGVLQAASAYGYNELTSNQGILLNRGQMVRVSDPTDHDMTGAIIFSQGNQFPLAVVWGEDACIAGPRDPFLDLGYTVLPLPVPEISKSSRLLIDADRSGDISPGDTLEYNIQITNNGVGPIDQPVLLDTLPYTFTDYLIGTITSTPAPLAGGFTYDDGSGIFAPLPPAPLNIPAPQVHKIKAAFPNIPAGGRLLVTLHIILDRQIPPNVFSVVNKAELSSNNAPTVGSQVTTPINQVDLQVHKTDGVTVANPPQRLTYTLTYTNAGPGIAHNAVMTDTLPPTAYDVVTLPQPGVITPTIQPGRVIFQLGTLLPNQTGTTTVSLTLQNTAQDPVVNTVVIGSRSFDHNPNNNTSIDIDRVLPADVQISKNDGLTVVERGNQLTYTLIYTNAGPGVAYNVVMTDTLPPTAINVSTPSVPGVITPTLQPGRIIFQLGTLQAGQNGRTTVTLTLGPSTPGGVNIVNSVEISTTSKDPNPGNNRSTDIDRTRGTTAVVLSEFRVERQAGGVLLAWRTVAEQDNYGFRIYRSRTPSRASAVLLTAQIIPGQGRGRADGAAYSFVDSGAPAGSVYYWLEDIDLNGVSTFHGPAQPFLQSVRTRIWLPLVGR
jgi:uncharacterized repeat protein (TIGR01451 family)